MTDATAFPTGWTYQGRDGVLRPAKPIGGVHDMLDRVNAERLKAGRQPLTAGQADHALWERGKGHDDGCVDFLIGFMTGIPMPSASGVMGAVLHYAGETTDAAHHAPAAPITGYTTEAPVSPEPAPTYDPGPSSSYDSGSSSSFDSGGSSGGSDSS